MLLSDIRLLVGVQLGQKGLPPTVIAPVVNILSLLDEELTAFCFIPSPQLEKEAERLKNAIITMNYNPADDDEDDITDDIALDDMLSSADEDEEDDDLDVDELLKDDDDDDE